MGVIDRKGDSRGGVARKKKWRGEREGKKGSGRSRKKVGGEERGRKGNGNEGWEKDVGKL